MRLPEQRAPPHPQHGHPGEETPHGLLSAPKAEERAGEYKRDEPKRYVKRTSFQFDEIAFDLTDWSGFWLMAKDVLRLTTARSLVYDRTALAEKNELPVVSFVKLNLFTGNSSELRLH